MLVHLVPKAPVSADLRRAWHVFFSDGERPGLWRFVTRRGFRHIEAAAYYADQDRWVFVIPARNRLVVAVKRPDESAALYDAMLARTTVAVRFEAAASGERMQMPPVLGCVGAIKALLGMKSRALSPYGLFRDLVANGAEILHGQHIQARYPAAAAGRPGSEATARP